MVLPSSFCTWKYRVSQSDYLSPSVSRLLGKLEPKRTKSLCYHNYMNRFVYFHIYYTTTTTIIKITVHSWMMFGPCTVLEERGIFTLLEGLRYQVRRGLKSGSILYDERPRLLSQFGECLPPSSPPPVLNCSSRSRKKRVLGLLG